MNNPDGVTESEALKEIIANFFRTKNGNRSGRRAPRVPKLRVRHAQSVIRSPASSTLAAEYRPERNGATGLPPTLDERAGWIDARPPQGFDMPAQQMSAAPRLAPEEPAPSLGVRLQWAPGELDRRAQQIDAGRTRVAGLGALR